MYVYMFLYTYIFSFVDMDIKRYVVGTLLYYLRVCSFSRARAFFSHALAFSLSISLCVPERETDFFLSLFLCLSLPVSVAEQSVCERTPDRERVRRPRCRGFHPTMCGVT